VIQVRARDQAGNNDSSPALGFWTADSTPPDTTITKAPSGFDSATGPDIEFSSSEANATFACSLDGAAATACSSPDHLSGLADGPHTFSVRATDAFGNQDPSAAAVQWTLDSTPPETTLTQTPDALTRLDFASFQFTTSEPKPSFECSLDNEAYAACTSPVHPINLAEGDHIFRVRSLDANGNPDQTPATFAWTVDHTKPPRPVLDVTSADTATRGKAVQPHQTQQPTNPTVPFGPGAAFASHGVPAFSLGPYLKASWKVPGTSEPLTYEASKSHFDMIKGSAGSSSTPLVPPGSTATTGTTNTVPGDTYCFGVQADDAAGNGSYFADTRCTTLPRRSKDLIRSGPWTEHTGKGHYRGGYLESTRGSLALKAYQAYSSGFYFVPAGGGLFVSHVAMVATRCKGCGTVKVTYRVYWESPADGTTKSRTINLNATSDKPAQLIPLFSSNPGDFGQHLDVKIEITSHRKTVRIEGLGVSQF
jgi:hypothetical protein